MNAAEALAASEAADNLPVVFFSITVADLFSVIDAGRDTPLSEEEQEAVLQQLQERRIDIRSSILDAFESYSYADAGWPQAARFALAENSIGHDLDEDSDDDDELDDDDETDEAQP